MERNIAILLALISLMGTSSWASNIQCVPTNWNYSWRFNDGTWYTRTHHLGNWNDAVNECKNIERSRTSIASIRTKNEQRFIERERIEVDHWVGGIQLGYKRWVWFTDKDFSMSVTPMGYTNWYTNRPDYPTGSYCMAIESSNTGYKPFTWNDYKCYLTSKAGLCELRC